jgi:hypothetical protein
MSQYVKYYNEITPVKWAVQTLNSDELAQFQAAQTENNSLWTNYATQGLISTVPIMQDVYVSELDQTIQVQVGERVVLAAGVTPADLLLAPAWAVWLERYTSEVNPTPVIFEP